MMSIAFWKEKFNSMALMWCRKTAKEWQRYKKEKDYILIVDVNIC